MTERNVKFQIGILLLILLVLLKFSSLSAFSGSGNGSLSNPFLITNCTQLQEMMYNLSANYSLGNDIDCSDTVNWNSGAGFIPVGNCTGLPCLPSYTFTGNFEGNNFTISDLYINSSKNYVGLFGDVNGSIRNLGLINESVTTSSNVLGGIAGVLDGSLSDSYATGNVTGVWYVGGLVGISYANLSISNSYAAGNIRGTGDSVGGLIGNIQGTLSLSNSYSAENVTGIHDYVGGLAGYFHNGTISNSFSSGNVTGSSFVGGLVGQLAAGYINNSYWYNLSTGLDCYSGGNSGCTAVSDISYFKDYDNPPMNLSSGDGWNFTTVWDDLYNGTDFPVLKWQVICGDSLCNNGEDCNSCPVDCGSCPGPSCQEYINSLPYNITQNDTYYCLNISSSNINETAIQFSIGIQNSTLNCSGYSLDGDGSGIYGVYLSNNASNNTVESCFVNDFGYGIVSYGDNNTIINNIINNSYFGIQLLGGSYNFISTNMVANSSIGIEINSSENNITNNMILSNTIDLGMGILLWGFSSNNSVSNNSILNNDYAIVINTFNTFNNNLTNNLICYNKYGLANITGINETGNYSTWLIDNNIFCIDPVYPANNHSYQLVSTFEFNVSNTIFSTTCQLYLNDTLNATTGTVQNNNLTVISYSVSEPGWYSWYVYCNGSSDTNSGNSSVNYFQIVLDNDPPNITIVNPVNRTTLDREVSDPPLNVNINISTDENAVCRYSLTNSIFDFSEGTNFSITGGTNHSFVYSGLSSGLFTLYYKCNDTFGNVNSESVYHEFFVAVYVIEHWGCPPSCPPPQTIYSMNITDLTSLVEIYQNQSKTTCFTLKNTGTGILSNISINLLNIPSSWFTISPTFISQLNTSKNISVCINFNIPYNAEARDYLLTVNASDRATKSANLTLRVLVSPSPQCPICQNCLEWSSCIDRIKTRTCSYCNESSGFVCSNYTQTEACEENVTSKCGNNLCEPGETIETCFSDCLFTAVPGLSIWAIVAIAVIIVMVIALWRYFAKPPSRPKAVVAKKTVEKV